MPMNWMHRKLCASPKWADAMARRIPWALEDTDLGGNVLEIGPGFGATTRVLAPKFPALTAIEVDEASANQLRAEFGERVRIVHGDGAAMPLPDEEYTGVCCFTMLHHVPTFEAQDRLFAEACRVLGPGGTFTGADSQLSLRFRLLHIGDTMNVVSAETLPDRLRAAGFTGVRTHLVPGKVLRFTARKA
jgi:SAM-dependent methyltransferase